MLRIVGQENGMTSETPSGASPGRAGGSGPEPRGADVAATIRAQHARVVTLVEAVNVSSGTERQQAFAALVALLARHEAAEEVAVHPVTAAMEPADAGISGQLVAAEEGAMQQVGRLEAFDVDSFEFTVQFQLLEEALSSHAAAEEAEELPVLHSLMTPEQAATALRVLAAVDNDAASPEEPGSFATQLEVARDRYRALIRA